MMFSGNERYLSILVASPILMVCVAMILSTITILKKGKQYNKFRRLMIALLIFTCSIALYLTYLTFAFGNSHPSATPVPMR